MPTAPTARRPVLVILLTAAMAAPAWAAPPECSCGHIEGLQQDYRNSVALQRYFETLAEHLRKIEADAMDETGNPTRVKSMSDEANTRYRQVNPPSRGLVPVQGYTGPSSVDMNYGTCTHIQLELDMMEAGSPCRAMADAALDHEAFHRANCDGMGADAYWDRLQSEIALEEVEAYKAQAAALKDELRRVLDVAQITYNAEWALEISAQGVAQYGYSYTAQSEDIGGASDGDPWTMTGQGTSTMVWTKAVIAGMNCSPAGAVNSTYEASITTDGLTFDLEISQLSSSGALSISCPGGGGGGGPVGEAGGGGTIAEGLPVKAGETVLPGDMASEMQAILAGMATVSGEGQRTLSVTCTAP